MIPKLKGIQQIFIRQVHRANRGNAFHKTFLTECETMPHLFWKAVIFRLVKLIANGKQQQQKISTTYLVFLFIIFSLYLQAEDKSRLK